MSEFYLSKLAISLGAAALLATVAVGEVIAQPAKHPGGHPGGGGAPHAAFAPHPMGGGAPHAAFAPHPMGGGAPRAAFAPHPMGGGAPHIGGFRPGGGMAHFARHAAPHANFGRLGGAAHIAGPRVSHFGAPRINRSAGARLHSRFGHVAGPRRNRFTGAHPSGIGRSFTPNANSRNVRAAHVPSAAAAVNGANRTNSRNAVFRAPVTAAARASDPRHFAAHRRFADNRAFRPFLGRGWHPHHHLGWVGPVFWPYAYGDFFYYSLWPNAYDYVDPVWAYGYDDIYNGIFSAYTYGRYVQGQGAPQRMTALTQSVAQSCADEAAEVTGWPINQIQNAVAPTKEQGVLLDDLGNAIVKASDVIKSNCPTDVSFTPTGRLDDMQQRLEGMVQAVNIVSPPLAKFYDSLNDEQKARFNDIGAAEVGKTARRQQAALTPNPQPSCGANPLAWPKEEIDRVVRPTDAQSGKLEALQSAAAKAADIIKAACPSQAPNTPPGRLEAVGKRLEAILQAVQTVRPALADFYNSLSDDQKARFNGIGQQIFAENRR